MYPPLTVVFIIHPTFLLPSSESGDRRRVRVTNQNKITKKIQPVHKTKFGTYGMLARRTPFLVSWLQHTGLHCRQGLAALLVVLRSETTSLLAGSNPSTLVKNFHYHFPLSTPPSHGNQSADDNKGWRGRKFRHITSLVPHGDNLERAFTARLSLTKSSDREGNHWQGSDWERAVTGRAVTDRAVTERAVTDRVVTERAVTDRAVTERAVTGRAVTDEGQ